MRLFAALDLPAGVKDTIAALVERLRPLAPQAKWVPRENMHLTLSFIGERPEPDVAPISDAIGEAVSGFVDFASRLEGLGAFPSARRVRVVWMGLADAAGGIAALADAIGGALEPLGVARESRTFVPHLTIARLRVPAPVELPAGDVVEPVGFSVERVTLFRSRLQRPAPVYEPLAVFPFRREPAPPRPD